VALDDHSIINISYCPIYYHKKYLHQSVDVHRFLFLRKMTLVYPLLSAPHFCPCSAPALSLLFYALMMIGGIIAGFFVRLSGEE
jgi:hypothetical protein